MIEKVISGGQTGADIAGVDAAIVCDAPYGGSLPRGRRNELGTVSDAYTDFVALTRGGYPMRTKQNVKDADGTIIFYNDKLTGGSKLTSKYVNRYNRFECLVRTSELSIPEAVAMIAKWVEDNDIRIVNVAGSCASKDPAIHSYVFRVMREVLHT